MCFEIKCGSMDNNAICCAVFLVEPLVILSFYLCVPCRKYIQVFDIKKLYYTGRRKPYELILENRSQENETYL